MTTEALCGMLGKALRMQGNLMGLEDVLNLVDTGDMQSFVEGDTWVITSVTEYPRRKVMDILLVVGELKPALELEARVIEFAKDNGVTLLRADGRVGWSSLALERGWKVVATTYHKDI